MADTKIEWADKAWNPIAGCTKCSPGCLNCYAERMAKRLIAMGQEKYYPVMDGRIDRPYGWNGEIKCYEELLDAPLGWHNPKRIFVCSMSDLFHPKVPFEFIDVVFFQISFCPQHIFLILTKRPKIMLKYIIQLYKGLNEFHHGKKFQWPFRNVHIGVSISNQDEANEKIPILLKIPAEVRWLSIEPMLEGISLKLLEGHDIKAIGTLTGKPCIRNLDTGAMLNWVVVGGESGPGARPMHPDWVRNIQDQCIDAGVPFYFKQWGEWLPVSQMTKEQNSVSKLSWWPNRVTDIEGERFFRFTKKKAGCLLDGKEWKQYPE